MNIRAVMAALKIEDLDRAAKMALIVLACRADQHTAMANVSIGRIAADIGVEYTTAWRALKRLVESGYVTVDKSAGRTSLWMLTPCILQEVPIAKTDNTPCTVQEGLLHSARHKESLEKVKERGSHFAPGSGVIVDFTSRRNGHD